MSREDHTFSDHSAFGSTRWAATVLGRSQDWFRQNLGTLSVAGFPKPDSITQLYLKADVNAWLERRRQIPNRGTAAEDHRRDAMKGSEISVSKQTDESQRKSKYDALSPKTKRRV